MARQCIETPPGWNHFPARPEALLDLFGDQDARNEVGDLEARQQAVAIEVAVEVDVAERDIPPHMSAMVFDTERDVGVASFVSACAMRDERDCKGERKANKRLHAHGALGAGAGEITSK